MLQYLVIGICIILLIAVIYFSAKPISMGIEARRNLNDDSVDQNSEKKQNLLDENDLILNKNQEGIADEIKKLNQLKNEGVITEEEYVKAKNKLLS